PGSAGECRTATSPARDRKDSSDWFFGALIRFAEHPTDARRRRRYADRPCQGGHNIHQLHRGFERAGAELRPEQAERDFDVVVVDGTVGDAASGTEFFNVIRLIGEHHIARTERVETVAEAALPYVVD